MYGVVFSSSILCDLFQHNFLFEGEADSETQLGKKAASSTFGAHFALTDIDVFNVHYDDCPSPWVSLRELDCSFLSLLPQHMFLASPAKVDKHLNVGEMTLNPSLGHVPPQG